MPDDQTTPSDRRQGRTERGPRSAGRHPWQREHEMCDGLLRLLIAHSRFDVRVVSKRAAWSHAPQQRTAAADGLRAHDDTD